MRAARTPFAATSHARGARSFRLFRRRRLAHDGAFGAFAATRLAWRSCVAVAAVSALSCGGSGTPPVTVAPARSAPATVAASPPDLSAVPEPSGLVASGRLGRPSAVLATVAGWSKRPVPQAEQITEALTGEALGPLVDLDQPLDFVAAVSGSGARAHQVSAISLALKDPEAAKAKLLEHHKLVPNGGGGLVIEGLGRVAHADGGDEVDDEPGRSCELAPAYGAAPVRLVCGTSAPVLSELAPWLTRTATRAVSRSDVHMDVKMRPVREAFSAQRRIATMLLASLIAERSRLFAAPDVTSALASDLVDFALDLESIALDIASTPAGDATAIATLGLTGTASTLGRVVTAHPERTGPPPAVFWQLPADAEAAFFGRGTDDAELARARDFVVRVVGDKVADLGLKSSDRLAILDAVGKLLSPAPVVYAGGVDEGAVKKALGTEKGQGASAGGTETDARRATTQALFGWHLFAIEEPAARLAGSMKDLALAWSRPAVVAAYQAHSKERTPPLSLRVAPLTNASALPAGSAHYVVELTADSQQPDPAAGGAAPARSAAARKPIAIHVLLVPDGARTWLGLGADEAAIASKLATAKSGAGATLASRDDLAALKDASVGFGGFATPRGLSLGAQLMGLSEGSMPRGGQRPSGGSRPSAPQGGEAVVFTGSAQPAAPARSSVVSLRLPRAAIEDILAVAMRFPM